MKPSTNWLNYQSVRLVSPAHPESQAHQFTFRTRLQWLWQFLVERLMEKSELRVWQTDDRFGNILWSAHDPSTGKVIHDVPEAEVRSWIEQRYYPNSRRDSSQ